MWCFKKLFFKFFNKNFSNNKNNKIKSNNTNSFNKNKTINKNSNVNNFTTNENNSKNLIIDKLIKIDLEIKKFESEIIECKECIEYRKNLVKQNSVKKSDMNVPVDPNKDGNQRVGVSGIPLYTLKERVNWFEEQNKNIQNYPLQYVNKNCNNKNCLSNQKKLKELKLQKKSPENKLHSFKKYE